MPNTTNQNIFSANKDNTAKYTKIETPVLVFAFILVFVLIKEMIPIDNMFARKNNDLSIQDTPNITPCSQIYFIIPNCDVNGRILAIPSTKDIIKLIIILMVSIYNYYIN